MHNNLLYAETSEVCKYMQNKLLTFIATDDQKAFKTDFALFFIIK